MQKNIFIGTMYEDGVSAKREYEERFLITGGLPPVIIIFFNIF